MKEELTELIEEEKRILLDDRPKAVFVGDTHGDLEASKRIWGRFGNEVREGLTYLVFLGDYMDRGANSRENIDFLVSKKAENPEGLILLLGNHDAYHLQELRPADFWKSLDHNEYEYYKNLAYLPWIAESDDVIAAHGALPFISTYKDLSGATDELYERRNDLGLPIWVSVAWGDLNPSVKKMRYDPFTGRPQFGTEIFLEYMNKHDRKILIRSHQPSMQGWAFRRRALTIFTSQVYIEMGQASGRTVSVVDLEKGVESSGDIQVLRLGQI